MRIPSSLASGEFGFNMTPMIDVVFLLIIFFLVSSHLARQETQMELPLPTAESSELALHVEHPRLTINVLEDGTLMLAGRPHAPGQLKQRLAESFAKGGSEMEVRIRADRQTPYSSVESVMVACAQTGIWNVTYAVYRKEVDR